MNLTKGKLKKLYKKNKQTMKKYKKNSKSNNKKNTFRKRKGLNLANKTLKKYA